MSERSEDRLRATDPVSNAFPEAGEVRSFSHLIDPLVRWFQAESRPPQENGRAGVRREANDGHLQVTSGSESLCGEVRDRNEDQCYSDPSAHLLVVADGMGGHQGGARASRFMVDTTASQLLPAVISEDASREELQQCVNRCIEQTRQAMTEWAATHPDDQHMGTTLAMAMIVGHTLHVAHVGDSRVYLLRSGRLYQLTVDETMAQALVDAGIMKADEALHSRYRHFLLNAVGVRELDHLPTVHSYPLEYGDRILLATDGITEFVSPDQIRDVLMSFKCPRDAAHQLAEVAQANHSSDNMTAVVAEIVRMDDVSHPMEAEADLSCGVANPEWAGLLSVA